MTNTEFVKKLLEVRKYPTKYAKGTFGQKATDSVIDQKTKQYPKWYTKSRAASLKALSDDTRLFDCVGLIKGVVWGFPDTIYTSNGLPDVSDQKIWEMATDKSTSFSSIEVGELLWLQGHVGVYIGEGKGIECTASWAGKVQVTAVANIGSIPGLNSRKWTGHGKLPFITYGNAPKPSENPKVDYSTYPILKKGSTGKYVKILQQLLVDKGYDPNGVDGIFGNGCLACVKKYQKENTDINGKKLVVDGMVGQKTWGSLYK